MGIDWCGLEAILLSVHECAKKENVCTLGRQSININEIQLNSLLNRYSIKSLFTKSEFSEDLFKHLGFQDCDSIDNSLYEGATILHDMNKSLLSLFKKKYSFIFDGGTSEHIFNCPQVFQNIIDLLEVGGIICSVVPNNNMSGHGMYQFSPEFFLSIFNEKYGMKMKHLYLIECGNDAINGINVNGYDLKYNLENEKYRNNAKFQTLNGVYIVAIAQKINSNSKTLLENPPNQYSYENYSWLKTT
jgi:hypothetical protein